MGATGEWAETQTTPGQASDDEEAVLCAMQLANAASLPMVLKAALELDVLEIMARSCPAAGGLISPAEIAAQLPTSNVEAPAMLDRILRLLASYSILTCKLDELPGGKVQRLYGLAPVCKFLTKNEDGVSLAPLCLMHHDKVHMASWYNFSHFCNLCSSTSC